MKKSIRTQGLKRSDGLHEHIERCLGFSLDWAQNDVRRVVVSLTDIKGPEAGNDKRCQLHIPLSRARDVVMDKVAADLPVASDLTVDRAARNLERRLSRQRAFRPTPLLQPEI